MIWNLAAARFVAARIGGFLGRPFGQAIPLRAFRPALGLLFLDRGPGFIGIEALHLYEFT